MGNAGHCTFGCGCLHGLRRADLQSSEEETQQKGIGCHRCCGICRGNSGDHSDRPDTDAALTGYPDVRDVTEEIENELIAKMLEVLEEFRYTQLFPQSGPASATLRAGSSIFTGSGSAAIWTVCSMILRWRSASSCGNTSSRAERGAIDKAEAPSVSAVYETGLYFTKIFRGVDR